MSYLIPKSISGLFTSPSPSETMRDLGTKIELQSGDLMKRADNAFSKTLSKGEALQVREAADLGGTEGIEHKREAFRVCANELEIMLIPGHSRSVAYSPASVVQMVRDTWKDYMQKSIDLETGLEKLSAIAENEKDAIDYLRRQKEANPEEYKKTMELLATQTKSEGLVQVVDMLVASEVQKVAPSMMQPAAAGQTETIEKKNV